MMIGCGQDGVALMRGGWAGPDVMLVLGAIMSCWVWYGRDATLHCSDNGEGDYIGFLSAATGEGGQGI